MRPIKFKQANTIYANNQYKELPLYKKRDGTVISQWQLSIKERIQIAITGKLWLTMLTFNQPLQPILPSIDTPFKKIETRPFWS